MAKSTGDDELNKIYNELRSHNISTGHERSSGSRSSGSGSTTDGDLMQFFVGLVMLAVGIYMILQNINVTSNWGLYSYHIGSFHLSNGMVMLPAVIGIGMLFMMERKIFGWIVFAIGIAIILASVFLTTHLYWKTTSAYTFLIMFGLTAAGAGLVIRQLFKKN
ncbi:MAG: hypothetical protein IKO47_06595 [Ruminococcus sp.]|nr:hypothetical protein [Ruminococcus sp.]